MRLFVGIAAALIILASHNVHAKNRGGVLPGPIQATVEKVIDGDTIAVKAHIWVGQDVSVLVRVAGVDTPELSGRCARERNKAKAARKFVSRIISGKKILLENIRQGKYAGRVIAHVTTPNGESLTKTLLETGHGRPYKKRRKNIWCCKSERCDIQQTRISKIKNYFGFDR